MSRTIIRQRDVREPMPEASSNPADATSDSYKERLLKLIPAEVISLYVSLDSIIRASGQPTSQTTEAAWFIFWIGLVATPLFLWRMSKVDKWLQLVIATGAFAVWVLALGGPFATLDWVRDHKLIAAFILPIYTFAIPLFYR